MNQLRGHQLPWVSTAMERRRAGVFGMDGRLDRLTRRLSVLAPPEPDELLVNYLRGLVLFGRERRVGAPLGWTRPPERAVIDATTAHVPSRLRSYRRKSDLTFRTDVRVSEVLVSCRDQRPGSWLNEPLLELYDTLAKRGFVGSVVAERGAELVGGLFGLRLGPVFGIVSMFHTESQAGALCLAELVMQLPAGPLALVDCGVPNANFARYGAVSVGAEEFSRRVIDLVCSPLTAM